MGYENEILIQDNDLIFQIYTNITNLQSKSNSITFAFTMLPTKYIYVYSKCGYCLGIQTQSLLYLS